MYKKHTFLHRHAEMEVTKKTSLPMISFCPYTLSCIGFLVLLLNGGPSAHLSIFTFQFPQHAVPQESYVFSYHQMTSVIFSTPPQQVSIADLLGKSQTFHQQLVSIRGLVTQPELHLDESELYLDFVFRLSQGTHSIIVYGRHDRTRGAPAISMNQTVEVIGTFWKEQNRNGSLIINALEAISVTPYPSSIPGST